jgi:hypothetical protein
VENTAVQTGQFFNGAVECSFQGGDTTQSMAKGAHKIEMVMEYLMQVIGVLITPTQDALKEILNSRSSCLWRQVKRVPLS